ncbi:ABC transporter substrate-binding protein [Spirilliplanes yamanashiensis]|uniref:ABC transporter substrate-binding protein n=1 Tax=Spirilliplanes yamanashiensis TaxID=42233 RepID=A0A8J3Y5V6_9ACTN|nr:iron-siderophore ABC transporter substrate-binding protein [Spirilliplanes yamanashiensis]MDP9814762.1 iron complex transport system substrate-binding protein [Spirilliplanes yamanashiensis]GIJ02416.1 ABC transporter substrate-binding protein [Spirilliplanes yamanashiensis]
MKLRPAAAAALLLLGLAACTNDAPAATDGGRTVTDGRGQQVSVPAAPARVVTLSEPTLDGALALGVTVVGTTSGRGQGAVSAYLADRAAGIPIVASVAGPNLEQILTLQPDLIVTDGTVTADDSVLGKLAAIAPTVYVSPTGADWKAAFTTLGEVLGKQAEAQQVLAGYQSRVDETKAELGDRADDTVSIVRWGLGQPSLLLRELPPSKVLADLGLRRPPAQDRDGPGHSSPVSRENLDQLDADWMFFGTLGGATNPAGGNTGDAAAVGRAASQTMLDDDAVATPGFTALTAYRNRQVVPVDGSAWTSSGGPLAATVILGDVAEAMTAS